VSRQAEAATSLSAWSSATGTTTPIADRRKHAPRPLTVASRQWPSDPRAHVDPRLVHGGIDDPGEAGRRRGGDPFADQIAARGARAEP
jgi:hypothetical protein